MSNAGFMVKLLKGAEVKWEPLGQVAKIKHGKDWKSLGTGNVPVYGSGGIMGYVDTYSYNKPTVLIPRKGSITNIFYIESPFWNVDTIYYTEIDNAKIIPKFFYYHMKTINLLELDTGAGRPSLTQAILNKIEIPIPPLDLQAEIVRILDAFTAHTAELTAELTARKKQYNYYRDQLLTFEEAKVKWEPLGVVCHIASGGTPSTAKKEYWENGDVPWLKSESCNNEPVHFANNFITKLGLKNSSAKILEKDTTLIALVGATIFKTAYLEFEATTNQNIASIKSKDSNVLSDKFVFYYITNLYNDLKSKMRNYGMLNLSTLRQFPIPIPPIAEQARIVAILDKFGALTNGLPREIELRKQQYEYYRDLLLSFPEAEVEA